MNTDFNIEDGLGYNLGTTFFALGGLLSKNLAEQQIDLTHKQAKMLMFLGHYEGVKQQELAGILQKDKPTITKMVDLLEQKRLVIRKQDVKDRRNRLLFLTEAGIRLRKKIIPVVQTTFEQATESLNDQEYKFLIDTLKKVRNNIHLNINEKE